MLLVTVISYVMMKDVLVYVQCHRSLTDKAGYGQPFRSLGPLALLSPNKSLLFPFKLLKLKSLINNIHSHPKTSYLK